jgi:protease I
MLHSLCLKSYGYSRIPGNAKVKQRWTIVDKVLIALADEFEDVEFSEPYMRLVDAGYEVTIVGSKNGESLKGVHGNVEALVQKTADQIALDDYDALVIPGGHSPDRLRLDKEIVGLTHRFVTSGRPVAAICHGPQLLIEADAVDGKTVTSWPSVRKDLINAGAHWVDQPVVEDDNLITSRKPDDLELFCNTLIEFLDCSRA